MEPEGHEKVYLKLIPPMNVWTFEPVLKITSWSLLPPHHGNQTICNLCLERSQSLSPASILHLHRRPEWGLNTWTFVLPIEAQPGTCYLRFLPPCPDRSFWTRHHSMLDKRKIFFCYNAWVCLHKLWGFSFSSPEYTVGYTWICACHIATPSSNKHFYSSHPELWFFGWYHHIWKIDDRNFSILIFHYRDRKGTERLVLFNMKKQNSISLNIIS